MQLPLCMLSLVTLLCLKVEKVQSQNTFCQTPHYRTLSPELQNEHQCIVLENLQILLDEEKAIRLDQYQTLYKMMAKFVIDINRSVKSLKSGRRNVKGSPVLQGVPLTRDCQELKMNGIWKSGVYPILLPNQQIVNVWCDMDTLYGGWTVIQRREDGSENFTREWDDYTYGFGNVNSEYWLGNENIHLLTNLKNFSLRIDLWDWNGNQAYAQYEKFKLEGEQDGYRLRLGRFSGTAGDSMSRYHNNMQFSTIDRDNDKWFLSCALKDQAAWWYRSCGFASLNGVYVNGGQSDPYEEGLIKGMIWYSWQRSFSVTMKRTEMKIKPLVNIKDDQERAMLSGNGKESDILEQTTDGDGLQTELDEFFDITAPPQTSTETWSDETDSWSTQDNGN